MTASNIWYLCVTQQSVCINLHASYSPIGHTTVWDYCICIIFLVFISCTNFTPWNQYIDSILFPCLCACRVNFLLYSELYSLGPLLSLICWILICTLCNQQWTVICTWDSQSYWAGYIKAEILTQITLDRAMRGNYICRGKHEDNRLKISVTGICRG